MRSPSSRTGSRLLLGAFLALLTTPLARATPCRPTCAGEVAVCRQRGCGGLAGRERHGCVRACRARSTCAAPGASIRTLAYAMSECRQDAQGNFSGRQKFLVRSGDWEPVVVMEFPPIGPVADPFNLFTALPGPMFYSTRFR